MKQCVRCSQVKTKQDFHKANTSRTLDGLAGWCKQCTLQYNNEKNLTYKGRIQKILSNMTQRAKSKGYTPSITLEQFITWIESQGYASMYEAWKDSNYVQRLVPTVDRVVALGSYEISNMQLLTYEQNVSKSYSEVKSNHTSITQFSLQEESIATYTSIREASRQTGVEVANINRAVNGKRKTAGGFIWRCHAESIKETIETFLKEQQ